MITMNAQTCTSIFERKSNSNFIEKESADFRIDFLKFIAPLSTVAF